MISTMLTFSRRGFLGLLGLTLIAPGASRAEAPRLYLYDKSPYGWTIGYPPGWGIDDSDPESVRFELKSATPALFGVHSGEVRFDQLSEFVDFMAAFRVDQFAAQGQAYREIDRRTRRLADRGRSRFVQIDSEIGGPKGGRSRAALFLWGRFGFAIDSECHSRDWPVHEPTFDLMIRSFKLPEG